ncbi:MAG: AtpZ/AtpI family protein [Bacteroidetes bacterium]|nr:AtpZ/AtpI family protein [Bacteroidota bacterium]MBS1975797.1 AtpZ/AtpI family protein [Bacteroidota bacterium]
MEQEHKPSEPRKPRPFDSLLKYSNFALQLFGGVGLAAWLGHKLDLYLSLKFPVFLLIFGLSVFAGMLYQVYKTFDTD